MVWCCKFFFSNISNIHRQYQEFFEVDSGNEQEGDDGVQDTPKMAKAQSVNRFYFAITFQLAKEDITKFKEMDEVNVYLCLNAASLLKERRMKEEEEIKKMQNKMKRK